LLETTERSAIFALGFFRIEFPKSMGSFRRHSHGNTTCTVSFWIEIDS